MPAKIYRLHAAETPREYWQFTGADRSLHALPIFHTHGLFVATNTIFGGGCLDDLPVATMAT